MKFLIDNQLPIALSRFFQAQGLESRHVIELGLDEVSDLEIWQYAKTEDYVIVSKDEDFLHLANLDTGGPALLWVRLGNCRKGPRRGERSEGYFAVRWSALRIPSASHWRINVW